MSEKLAIQGGERVVPEGMVRPWPPIDETDHALVRASLDSHEHVFGENLRALQKEFAAWNGNRFVLATNCGTAALHMCMAACGCGLGDEVIVPAWSWPSSASCVIHNDAIPVFVDIDFETMNIDVEKIEAAITPKTKAILVVHLHGLSVRMDRVMEIAERHGLMVVEDACQGHGALFQGRKAGTWGHCASFSCNHNKLLCAGEGGFFVTDDEALFRRGQMLGVFGETRDPEPGDGYHPYAMAWKYNSNDLVSAFARAQLAKLNGYLERIRENIAVLQEELQGVPHLILPVEPEGFQHNWYNYTVRFDMASLGHEDQPTAMRDALIAALNAEGVPNGAWQQFILPTMSVFKAKNAYGHGHPWASPHANEVDYSPEQYPAAQRHCETHTCLVMATRPPNGPDVARLLGRGIRKVMENAQAIRPV